MHGISHINRLYRALLGGLGYFCELEFIRWHDLFPPWLDDVPLYRPILHDFHGVTTTLTLALGNWRWYFQGHI